jgi:hypothetical protein
VRLLYPLYLRLLSPALLRPDAVHLRELIWHVALPETATAHPAMQLTFVITRRRNGRMLNWSDDERKLGIHLRSLKLERVADA